MAPPSKRITPVGQHLRALRAARSLSQSTFGALVYASARTVSRWENGLQPMHPYTNRIMDQCKGLQPEFQNALARALGFELIDDEEPTVVQAPVPPPRPQASSVDLRSALDAVVYAAAEERDVLPRHLRAFGVELLLRVEQLGIGNREAAGLIAARERTKGPEAREG